MGTGKRLGFGVIIALGLVVLPSDLQLAAQERCFAEPISYPNDGLKITGAIMKPAGNGPFPAVIFNHGSRRGAEQVPTVRPDTLCFPVVADQRWVYLIIDRRGYGASEGPSYFATLGNLQGTQLYPVATARLWSEARDVVAGVEFLGRLPYVDRERIALTGQSLGGIVSIFAASLEPTRVRAVVSMAGGFSDVGARHSLQEMIRAGERIRAPILLLHGLSDERVPIWVSVELRDALRNQGKDVELRAYPGPHNLFAPYPLGDWGRDLVEFLQRQFSQSR